jgi:hypothetical protein
VTTFFVLGVVCASLTPTRNEAILIMAGGKTLDFAQSDTSLSKIPYEATEIISGYLEKSIKELKKENTH